MYPSRTFRQAVGFVILVLLFVGCRIDPLPKENDLHISRQPPATVSTPFGTLDEVSGDARVGGRLQARGWAIDPVDGARVCRIVILVDDTPFSNATQGRERADVAVSINHPQWLRCGFVATLLLDSLEPGKHTVSAVVYNSSGASAKLNGNWPIEVASR